MILLLKHNWNLGIQNVFNDLWLLIRVNDYFRADTRLAPSQWEMSLQCNVVSHWLGARLESALLFHSQSLAVDDLMANFIAIDPSHKSHNASHKYPIMHHFVTEMCTFLLQNVALWDMTQMHSGICEMEQMVETQGWNSALKSRQKPIMHGVKIVTADDLATLGARSSAGWVLM